MSEETEANPAEGDELLPEAGADETNTDVTETEVELDENGEPIVAEEVEDDTEEVEHAGQKYKVPKALKPALMMQADYTKKTMELAESRKALDAERAQALQADEEELDARATLKSVDKRIAEYRALTTAEWQNWYANDYGAAQAGRVEYDSLKDERADLAEKVQQKTKARTEASQQITAKQAQEALAVLQKDIPGWGAELAAKLEEFTINDLGYSPQEVAQITDPRTVKLIHAAYQAKLAQSKTKTVQKIAQAQATRPAATVPAKGSVLPTGLDDRLPIDEWNRRRNAQLAKKRA